jgi:two-component system NtrC family response regulator
MKAKIYIVEDDLSLLEIAEHQLESEGYEVIKFSSADLAWDNIYTDKPDLILSDLILENSMNGDAFLKKVHDSKLGIPVIILTANATVESAVDCMQNGAWNYLLKPFRWAEVFLHINKALSFKAIKKENKNLSSAIESYKNYSNILGSSKEITDVKKQLSRISHSDAPVLIQGESGTGKELVARCIHATSERSNNIFLAVNCGAIVPSLAESELFGHCRGAFTGAVKDKKGLFQEANGGTIFLDEIGELSLDLQVKVLRVIQEMEVVPVGQSHSVPIDVRIVTATHVDLDQAIKEKEFREDLFYRISVLPLSLPPLRKRGEDIQELLVYFLNKNGVIFPSFSEKFLETIKWYKWPGNIRELENFALRLVVLNPNVDKFEDKHLTDFKLKSEIKEIDKFILPNDCFNLEDHIKALIVSALDKSGGNQTKAANILGLTRSALIYRMQKFNIRH